MASSCMGVSGSDTHTEGRSAYSEVVLANLPTMPSNPSPHMQPAHTCLTRQQGALEHSAHTLTHTRPLLLSASRSSSHPHGHPVEAPVWLKATKCKSADTHSTDTPRRQECAAVIFGTWADAGHTQPQPAGSKTPKCWCPHSIYNNSQKQSNPTAHKQNRRAAGTPGNIHARPHTPDIFLVQGNLPAHIHTCVYGRPPHNAPGLTTAHGHSRSCCAKRGICLARASTAQHKICAHAAAALTHASYQAC